MKKNLMTIALLSASIFATTDIGGVWQLTKLTTDGETIEFKLIVDFNQDSMIYVSGQDFGGWSYDSSNNTFISEAEMQLENLNGVNQVKLINEQNLILINSKNDSTFFKRYALYEKDYLKNDIVGSYTFAKLTIDKKEVKVPSDTYTFNQNGLVYVKNIIMGKWTSSKDILTIDTPKMKELMGEYSVNHKSKMMILNKLKSKQSLSINFKLI